MHLASGRPPLPLRRATTSGSDSLRERAIAQALRLTILLSVLLSVALGSSATALAHPDLDQGVQSAEEADFDAALAAFERALDSGTLTRDELVVLLSERALVLHALGQKGALAWDLANLALIEPGRSLGRRAPPELVQAFAEATARQGATVTIHVACEPSSTGLRLTAEVKGLSDPSLGSVVIHTRKADASQVNHQAAEAEVSIGPGESLLYSAELVGMGKVVLANDGSPAAPKVCEAPNLNEQPVVAMGTDKQDGKNRKLWWWLGAGGVVAVTAVTVGIIVATNKDDPSNETSVGRPMVSFK